MPLIAAVRALSRHINAGNHYVVAAPPRPELGRALDAVQSVYYSGDSAVADRLLTCLRPVLGDGAVKEPAAGWSSENTS